MKFKDENGGEWESQHEYPGGSHDIRRVEKKSSQGNEDRKTGMINGVCDHLMDCFAFGVRFSVARCCSDTYTAAVETCREEIAAATGKLEKKLEHLDTEFQSLMLSVEKHEQRIAALEVETSKKIEAVRDLMVKDFKWGEQERDKLKERIAALENETRKLRSLNETGCDG